jgi:hypothetical protein
MSQVHNCIENALDKKFKLGKKLPEYPSELEWFNFCLVTQDWDELNEFIFTNNLKIPESARPVYFNPQSKWSCLYLPKIKIRWKENYQVRLGCTMYNILEGEWLNGYFIPKIAPGNMLVKIKPYYIDYKLPNVVLIPVKSYCVSQNITEIPTVTIADENLDCVYASMYCNVSFNRQGLYINRKFRDKVVEIDISKLPLEYIIVEPAFIEISSISGNHNLKINLAGII